MPNTSYTQQALAYDPNFQLRVRAAIATVAWTVMNEDAAVEHHETRAAYARQVIRDLGIAAMSIAPWLVQRPNLMSFETSYDFTAGHVMTLSGDLDIESQLMSDWDVLAGVVETPPPPPPPAAFGAPPIPPPVR